MARYEILLGGDETISPTILRYTPSAGPLRLSNIPALLVGFQFIEWLLLASFPYEHWRSGKLRKIYSSWQSKAVVGDADASFPSAKARVSLPILMPEVARPPDIPQILALLA